MVRRGRWAASWPAQPPTALKHRTHPHWARSLGGELACPASNDPEAQRPTHIGGRQVTRRRVGLPSQQRPETTKPTHIQSSRAGAPARATASHPRESRCTRASSLTTDRCHTPEATNPTSTGCQNKGGSAPAHPENRTEGTAGVRGARPPGYTAPVEGEGAKHRTGLENTGALVSPLGGLAQCGSGRTGIPQRRFFSEPGGHECAGSLFSTGRVVLVFPCREDFPRRVMGSWVACQRTPRLNRERSWSPHPRCSTRTSSGPWCS